MSWSTTTTVTSLTGYAGPVTVRMTVVGVDYYALTADEGLRTAFEDGIKESHASELADYGVSPSDVDVRLFPASVLVSATINMPGGVSAATVLWHVSASATLGPRVVEAVMRVPGMEAVVTGDVDVTDMLVTAQSTMVRSAAATHQTAHAGLDLILLAGGLVGLMSLLCLACLLCYLRRLMRLRWLRCDTTLPQVDLSAEASSDICLDLDIDMMPSEEEQVDSSAEAQRKVCFDLGIDSMPSEEARASPPPSTRTASLMGPLTVAREPRREADSSAEAQGDVYLGFNVDSTPSEEARVSSPPSTRAAPLMEPLRGAREPRREGPSPLGHEKRRR